MVLDMTSAYIYSAVPLYCGIIYHDITHNIAITAAELKPDFELTKYKPCFALTDEIRGAYCENCGEKWSCYNGIALYFDIPTNILSMA